MRVCRPGGRIGLANWTPESLVGRLFQVLGRHVPPPAGAKPPTAWGVESNLRAFFGEQAAAIEVTRRIFNFRYASAHHVVHVFRPGYAPLHKAFAAPRAY